MYHLYVFGAKRAKHDARARTNAKRRRKGKKEKKWVRGEVWRVVCVACASSVWSRVRRFVRIVKLCLFGVFVVDVVCSGEWLIISSLFLWVVWLADFWSHVDTVEVIWWMVKGVMMISIEIVIVLFNENRGEFVKTTTQWFTEIPIIHTTIAPTNTPH